MQDFVTTQEHVVSSNSALSRTITICKISSLWWLRILGKKASGQHKRSDGKQSKKGKLKGRKSSWEKENEAKGKLWLFRSSITACLSKSGLVIMTRQGSPFLRYSSLFCKTKEENWRKNTHYLKWQLIMFDTFVFLFFYYCICFSLFCSFIVSSLLFLLLTQLPFSRIVPPCKYGPDQGFFLLKGFFLATPLTWGFLLWISSSVKYLETILL